MAHIAKYKATSVGHMLAHYRRDASSLERGSILDSIAARCDGLRGRVEHVVEGIRGAVGRLEVAIADLARKLGPRSARMTTRALKRDLAALEEDMSPVALASGA